MTDAGSQRSVWRGGVLLLIAAPASLYFALAFSMPQVVINRWLFHNGRGAERVSDLRHPFAALAFVGAASWLLLSALRQFFPTAALRSAMAATSLAAGLLAVGNAARVTAWATNDLLGVSVAPAAVLLFGVHNALTAARRPQPALGAVAWLVTLVSVPVTLATFVGLAMPGNG